LFGRKRRRRGRRQEAGWLGRYAIEPRRRHDWDVGLGASLDWSRCRVLDVGPGGAGLELLGAPAEVGDRLIVDLQLVRSNMASVTLTGEIRHSGSTDDGGQRVGLEFVEVGDLERALLQRLLKRQKQARKHLMLVEPEEGVSDAPIR
jgi:PilZ domain